MTRILIDTNALYAFVMGDDAHHVEADSYLRLVRTNGDIFVLVDLVFVETMTLLKSHAGSAVSIRAGREFRQSPLYQWQSLGADGERDTWALFQRYDDKDWSYTDCALLAMAQRLSVPQVFSFDSHLDQMPYVTRVPKPSPAYRARR